MTKTSIVRTVSEEIELTRVQTKQIVQKVFDAIVRILVEERRVELRNFGVFEVQWRKPRKARNPRTGEKLTAPGRCAVTFKPGRLMQERVEAESRIEATADAVNQNGQKATAEAQ